MRRSDVESTPAPSLTSIEASDRLQLVGPNTLPQPCGLPLWQRVLRAVRDPLVLVLLCAIALTILTRDSTDTIVIALVIVVNTTLAVRQEISADRAVSALGALVAPVVRVLRDGREVSRPVTELVPGDLVVLAEGDLVPADSLLVGQHVDGVVISILQDISQLPKVMTVAEKLNQLNIPLLGAVVNGIKADIHAYGYNYVKQLPA